MQSSIFADSPSLSFLAQSSAGLAGPRPGADQPSAPPPGMIGDEDDDDAGSIHSRHLDDLDPEPAREMYLYLPVPLESDISVPEAKLEEQDVDMLVLFRNLFSLLVGQSLVATPRFPGIFAIFMEVSGLLARFEFSNLDGSTFGETVTSSFGCYCDELSLSDIRKSRFMVLEAIVLGERMRYLPLYQEGFVHAVGRMDEMRDLFKTHGSLISTVTMQRLERGYMDLENRVKTVREKLDDFYFPMLFAGIGNSNSASEAKISFRDWKSACLALRKNVMSYYRHRFGSWPPKGSKKNPLGTGLNRTVLRELYHDMCDMYDLLVDRSSLTTRSIDMTSNLNDKDVDKSEIPAMAVRQVESEYDRSTPPVSPPVPFDIPLVPNIQSIQRKKPPHAKAESALRHKKLRAGELGEILFKSYNMDAVKPTPFLQNFMEFERSYGSGRSSVELANNRYGQWLFMYAVLQSLPMLAVDATEAQSTDNVDYFLCVPPRLGAPWVKEDPKNARSWFGVAGGAGVVSLPADVVAHGVEAVYRRSHCWQVAEKWADEQGLGQDPIEADGAGSEEDEYEDGEDVAGADSDDPDLLTAPEDTGEYCPQQGGLEQQFQQMNLNGSMMMAPNGQMVMVMPTQFFNNNSQDFGGGGGAGGAGALGQQSPPLLPMMQPLPALQSVPSSAPQSRPPSEQLSPTPPQAPHQSFSPNNNPDPAFSLGGSPAAASPSAQPSAPPTITEPNNRISVAVSSPGGNPVSSAASAASLQPFAAPNFNLNFTPVPGGGGSGMSSAGSLIAPTPIGGGNRASFIGSAAPSFVGAMPASAPGSATGSMSNVPGSGAVTLGVGPQPRPRARPRPSVVSTSNSGGLTVPENSVRGGNRSSIHVGLEALPVPASMIENPAQARASTYNPDMSFDDILSSMPNRKDKKKKK